MANLIKRGAELQEDIDQLMVFNPPHISAYALTVEHNTRLAKQVELEGVASR